jgi:hypothetical protein
MKRRSRVQFLLLILALAITSCAAWALQTGKKLTMNGSIISTDIQIVHGRTYVPLSDMAKALDMTVVTRGGIYRFARAGGANQIGGIPGKINADISSGTWLLRVTSVRQVSGYSQQYGVDKAQLLPAEAGDILVVIKCRLKNDTKEMQEVYFDKESAGNTALMDDQEHGYVPLAYDSRNSDYTSVKIPSGSEHDFVIIFSIPKGANLKDLIYTVGNNETDKSTDFRVSLKP